MTSRHKLDPNIRPSKEITDKMLKGIQGCKTDFHPPMKTDLFSQLGIPILLPEKKKMKKAKTNQEFLNFVKNSKKNDIL